MQITQATQPRLVIFALALECHDIEMALYNHMYIHTYVYCELSGSRECQVIMGFAYEYTYQDHEYIIRTMNTKHERCLAFLFQAAHKIGGSCPKYIYCKLLRQC